MREPDHADFLSGQTNASRLPESVHDDKNRQIRILVMIFSGLVEPGMRIYDGAPHFLAGINRSRVSPEDFALTQRALHLWPAVKKEISICPLPARGLIVQFPAMLGSFDTPSAV